MTISNVNSDHAVLGELGQRLAHTRLEKNVSQAELAAEAGISKTTLERIERGDPVQTNNFIRVLRALGRLDELDRVLTEPLPSPIERLDLEGRRRRRATGRRPRESASPTPWKWADDPKR